MSIGTLRDSKGRFKKGYKLSNDSRNHIHLIEFTKFKSMESNSLYYGLYNLGYNDKDISVITSTPKSTISNWRWRRGLKPLSKDNGRFKEGQLPWNKGIPCKLETKQKLSKSQKGKHWSTQTEWKQGEVPKGSKIFEEGNKHPNWKGGLSFFRGDDWNKQRINILERDKRCKLCGNNKSLSVHHIIPYRISKNNNESNLIVLCRKCHTTLERMYDSNNNKYLKIIEEVRYI